MEHSVQEIGQVIEVSGDQVKIVIKRHASCESCGACGLGKQAEITMTAPNDLGAVQGDRVRLRLATGKMYRAAFLVYTVPLLMMFAGYFTGQAVAGNYGASAGTAENIGIFSGLAAIALSYLALHLWEQKKQLGRRFQPQLVEIINAPEQDALSSR